MPSRRLPDKIAIVTGGASGIGLATARRFVDHGATVVIADANGAAAERVAAESERTHAVRHDVTDEAGWKTLVEETIARFGRLDVLVNSAGVAVFTDIERCTFEEYRTTMAVNVDGTFLGCREAVRAMKPHGGSIVNLSSVSGLIGGHNTPAYNASKGAVRMLTKSVALYCAGRGYGIRCNSVHPAVIETPMATALIERRGRPDETRAAILKQIPLGRLGRADEVADMILYLASDESQFVTGSEFVIDGGLTAG